jgi:outer membrane protein OmpA-like peptidoglycan-associated protein
MKKLLLTIFLPLFSFATMADGFIVQIAAYGERVDMTLFTDAGLLAVHEAVDRNGIWKYHLGTFTDEKTAEKVKETAQTAGFKFARTINVQEQERLCQSACNLYVNPVPDFRLNHLFFDFDKTELTAMSKVQLGRLVELLDGNREYSLELHAHTDAKGSNNYNDELSENRKEVVIQHLEQLGVQTERINTFAYGETRPIAANSIGGQDNPYGRQLNRRVELVIKQGDKVLDFVEDIFVGIGNTRYQP